MPFFYYYDWTWLLLIPAILAGIWAQTAIQSAYRKYSDVYARAGWTAADLARDLLDKNGLYDVAVQRSPGGRLSDHYDPKANVLRLSDGVYSSSSIAALGIAAHETGHALQKNQGYAPLAARSAIVPIANIGSFLAWPLLLIGLMFSSYNLALIGVALFGAAVLFQFITLPVEFNASGRALALLENGGYLTPDEVSGARKVLNAAAMTYVAATLMSVMQLLRLLTIANRTRD